MPPMITTTSELSRNCPSSPGASVPNEPPKPPPSPARKEPTKNAIANVIWMLIPSACTIARSSTPARITIPVRVFLSQSQSSTPTPTAKKRMKRRKTEYWTLSMRRLTKRSSLSGMAMSFATPPQCSSIRSATMIEKAIVISAWRSSWPWFQRSSDCCMPRPMTPTMSPPMRSGKTHSIQKRSTSELCRPMSPLPTQWRCRVSAM